MCSKLQLQIRKNIQGNPQLIRLQLVLCSQNLAKILQINIDLSLLTKISPSHSSQTHDLLPLQLLHHIYLIQPFHDLFLGVIQLFPCLFHPLLRCKVFPQLTYPFLLNFPPFRLSCQFLIVVSDSLFSNLEIILTIYQLQIHNIFGIGRYLLEARIFCFYSCFCLLAITVCVDPAD